MNIFIICANKYDHELKENEVTHFIDCGGNKRKWNEKWKRKWIENVVIKIKSKYIN